MQLSRSVAHDLHLEFFPAEHRFLDQHFVGRRGVDAALDDLDELGLVVGDAAAGAAERERRPDDRRQADVVERLERLDQRLDLPGARRFEPDPLHRLAEQLAVLGLVDGVGGGADHLDVEFVQHAHLPQRQRGIERGLSAHGGQQREAAGNDVTLLLDDLGDDLRRDRLDIGGVGEIGVGHDRRRVGIHQHDPVALFLERLAGLRAGIIELAGLADDDRAGADDQDRGDVGPFGHRRSTYGLAQAQKKGALSRVLRSRARFAVRRPELFRPRNPGHGKCSPTRVRQANAPTANSPRNAMKPMRRQSVDDRPSFAVPPR